MHISRRRSGHKSTTSSVDRSKTRGGGGGGVGLFFFLSSSCCYSRKREVSCSCCCVSFYLERERDAGATASHRERRFIQEEKAWVCGRGEERNSASTSLQRVVLLLLPSCSCLWALTSLGESGPSLYKRRPPLPSQVQSYPNYSPLYNSCSRASFCRQTNRPRTHQPTKR